MALVDKMFTLVVDASPSTGAVLSSFIVLIFAEAGMFETSLTPVIVIVILPSL